MRLSDSIESFIKEMLSPEAPEVELKRSELAEYFGCAPSQINYVLSTRFTADDGYVIESRRGGGGYIRIVRIVRETGDQLKYLLNERIGDSISANDAQIVCKQLAEHGTITADDAYLMIAATSQTAFSAPVPESMKDVLRARVLRCMLLSVMQRRSS